jgi:hypothetical protein
MRGEGLLELRMKCRVDKGCSEAISNVDFGYIDC